MWERGGLCLWHWPWLKLISSIVMGFTIFEGAQRPISRQIQNEASVASGKIGKNKVSLGNQSERWDLLGGQWTKLAGVGLWHRPLAFAMGHICENYGTSARSVGPSSGTISGTYSGTSRIYVDQWDLYEVYVDLYEVFLNLLNLVVGHVGQNQSGSNPLVFTPNMGNQVCQVSLKNEIFFQSRNC